MAFTLFLHFATPILTPVSTNLPKCPAHILHKVILTLLSLCPWQLGAKLAYHVPFQNQSTDTSRNGDLSEKHRLLG